MINTNEKNKEVKITPNLQLGKSVHERLKTDCEGDCEVTEYFKNNRKIAKIIKKMNDFRNNIPEEGILAKKFNKKMNKYFNKITKITSKNKEYVNKAAMSVRKQFTPEEIKQLRHYQKSEDYWING